MYENICCEKTHKETILQYVTPLFPVFEFQVIIFFHCSKILLQSIMPFLISNIITLEN